MDAIKTYILELWQSDMVQDMLQHVIAYLLSFVDMGVVHDEVFIIIFAILLFIGFFFLLAIFTRGITRAISIFFAFLMMIGAMTIYASVGTGLLQVKFDEEKLQARAELERKRAEENKPPEIPPAVPQVPLDTNIPVPAAKGKANGGSLGLPENDKIHWEIYDPYEKPVSLDKDKLQAQKSQPPKSEAKPQASEVTKAAPDETPEKKAMRAKIGKELAQIEQELTFNVTYVDSHLQDLDKRLQSGEINQMTALAQKARWGIEKQGMILEAMDEKVAVLMSADLLSETDKANDLRTINQRRQAANDRLTEYQNVLKQLEGNQEVLQAVW